MIEESKVIVIGDLMLDCYIWGKCTRISPEAPIPVVEVVSEQQSLGGAGNVVKNLLSLDLRVHVFGVVGDDSSGERIREMLSASGVDTSGLTLDKGRKTTTKSRVVANKQQIVRIDAETHTDIDIRTENEIIEGVKKILRTGDVIVVSDYAKGVITPELCREIIDYANQLNVKVLVDPKGKSYEKYNNAYLITPNKNEASIACNMEIVNAQTLDSAGNYLRTKFNIKNVVITLSEDGMALFRENAVLQIPTVAKTVADVTGAGDTVVATLAYGLMKGLGIEAACGLANRAAGIVVGKLGSVAIEKQELDA